MFVFSGEVNSTEYAFGIVRLKENWEFPKLSCHVQLVNPSKVHGRKHLVHCIFLTVEAFKRKENIASDQELELLVRLAGTKQIKDAIKLLGPKDKAVLVVFGENAKKCFLDSLEQLAAKELDESLEKIGEKDAMERAALVGVQ